MKSKQPWIVGALVVSFLVIIILIFTSSRKSDLKAAADAAAAAAQEHVELIALEDRPDVPREVKNWPQEQLKLGQVSGVSVNSDLQPVIFHRVNRVWDQNTFNISSIYQHQNLGPIKEATILTLHPSTGRVIKNEGQNFFYMPHGITIDKYDNVWVTDVAMHQAFKFRPGEIAPSLTFGQKFVPGKSKEHLCMPTSIAVASTGEIFLADGYCNSRILTFNSLGKLINVLESGPESHGNLNVPHGVALVEPSNRICIADRENRRVVCPKTGLLQKQMGVPLTIQAPDVGRIFDVASKGHLIYAVTGPTSPLIPVEGLIIDTRKELVIGSWTPAEGFGNPHAIAISPNLSALYVSEISPNRIWKFELVPPK